MCVNIIISKLAEANDLKGVIDVADFNEEEKLGTGKEMVDRLSNLVAIFNRPELDFRKNRAEGDDILGDAYEYLMRHFATESGKSKGQFYTPSEVSRIMAKAIGINASQRADQTIYDPTCGSGSLLLKARDEAPAGITIYGQEKDVATRALAKMNMVLHDCPTAEIWRDNTLANPHFKNDNGSLKTFDFVVANPPFSDKAWGTGLDPSSANFWSGIDRMQPASASRRSPALASSLPQRSRPASRIRPSSSRADSSRLSSALCHDRTRLGARTASGTSRRWATATCGACWLSAPPP